MNYQEIINQRENRKDLQREMSQGFTRKEKLRNVLKLSIGTLVVGAILAGVIFLILSARVETQGEKISLQGREHIQVGAKHEEYNSNPPTSGSHYAKEADWGIYESELPDEQAIHNLEHGGIWLSYKNLNSVELNQLKQFAKEHPQSIILSPREKNDSKVAVASWTRLMKLDEVNVEKIELFYKGNKNKSPEPLAGK